MVSLKRSSLLLFGLLLTVFIAACSNPLSGNTSTTGSTTTNNTTTAKSNATSTGYGKTSAMTTSTPMAKSTMPAQSNTMGNNNSTMSNSNALIHTTQVVLNGKTITVLTNAKGLVLYYKLNDPRPASACTGSCAMAWPPVLSNSMNMNTMVSSSMQLPHKLTVYKTVNGNQVEYDGHPLYTYAGDMTPGQFTGRGMGNVWYLVSLGL